MIQTVVNNTNLRLERGATDYAGTPVVVLHFETCYWDSEGAPLRVNGEIVIDHRFSFPIPEEGIDDVIAGLRGSKIIVPSLDASQLKGL